MGKPVWFYSEGQKIFADFCLPREGAPCILLSHGFESSKDGDKWLVLAPRLSDEGFACLRFNYRGCGEGAEKSEGEFEDTTLTGRVRDYKAAIDWLHQTKVSPNWLGVVGSSFGSMVALAAKDQRVKAMVIMATPARIRQPRGKEADILREKGYLELASGKKLTSKFYRDIEKYNIVRDISQIGCPILIIHADQDELVPVGDAYRLYKYANEPKRLEIIEHSNHKLNSPEHMEKIANLTLEWFGRYL